MCGIVGFAGKTDAVSVLLDGLEKLEYRGYDSAGVAVVSQDGRLQIKKSKGRLAVLREQLSKSEPIEGNIGISHTRWATHGEPNDINAHPHTGENGKIAVVHNGIIENYLEIKQFLINEGVTFYSDTDTEVIAQLLDYYYKQNSDITECVYKVLNRIRGAYALGIICSDCPDKLIAARKDAPLLIGYGENSNFIASDVTALLAYTRTVSYMDDNEVAVITPDSVTVYDADKNVIEKEKHTVEWDVSAAEKGGYRHFMLKEITEQPEAIAKTVNPRMKDGRICFEELAENPDFLKDVSKIYIIACGSAYHVGMVGKYTLEKLLKIPTEACLASEFRYCDPLVDENTLAIVISQSGETLDSMAAMREAKKRGAKVISLVNVIGSSIARESDIVLYTWAGPEIAVATTKAYSTQLVLLTMFAVYYSDILGIITESEYVSFMRELELLPSKVSEILKDTEKYQEAAARFFNHDSVFFIGRNLDYALGLEGSLKLKEISYIHSESYAAGELKHGTISLIEPGTLVVSLATYAPLIEKTASNVVEVQSRGAEVLTIATQSNAEKLKTKKENSFTVPDTDPLLQPNLGVIPLQLFAYYVALNRGCDIDKPRNLAKSVTVE